VKNCEPCATSPHPCKKTKSQGMGHPDVSYRIAGAATRRAMLIIGVLPGGWQALNEELRTMRHQPPSLVKLKVLHPPQTETTGDSGRPRFGF